MTRLNVGTEKSRPILLNTETNSSCSYSTKNLITHTNYSNISLIVIENLNFHQLEFVLPTNNFLSSETIDECNQLRIDHPP